MKGKNHFMELQKKPYLQIMISGIQVALEKLQWLEPFIDDVPNVAHFGCSSGMQTIALLWKFSSSEVVGLDIKRNRIRQAQTDLSTLRKELTEMAYVINRKYVSPFDKDWWSNVDDFFKWHLVSKECEIKFKVQDVTLPTSLPKNYYDLAFADYVLHHIWFAEGGPLISSRTKFAVGEMVRVTKPGGYIAVHELLQYKDGRTIDFRTLFEQFNLNKVHAKVISSDYGKSAKYIYSKRL